MLSAECGFAVLTASMCGSKVQDLGTNLLSSVLFFLIISLSVVSELCYSS